ncbi:glycosyltransferase [Actinopolymorpha pittospori]|uniref:UDP-N-acetylglucosamine transferase subunit ALG13 n=1 Tax=Actinopolymorpha pittospori TaxID=648752 RepID=A0A927N4K5_9ACTN|nr:glycosyltransferase [Actinopolymorpha pittospori]MBE1611969.1 UDP-N-acetylglucosamine transferase subunit ALG13 [Actinopolymorpha pittospori]
MRLLAMVGTDYHPFHRLVRWVDHWAMQQPGVECLIQYGTAMPPRHADGTAYAEPDQLGSWMDDAGILVCHAGPSTILEARRRGHLPIVVPRRALWGEHVDDHQERFAGRLAQSGHVLTAATQQEFDVLLDAALRDPRVVRRTDSDDDQRPDQAVRTFGALVAKLFR